MPRRCVVPALYSTRPEGARMLVTRFPARMLFIEHCCQYLAVSISHAFNQCARRADTFLHAYKVLSDEVRTQCVQSRIDFSSLPIPFQRVSPFASRPQYSLTLLNLLQPMSEPSLVPWSPLGMIRPRRYPMLVLRPPRNIPGLLSFSYKIVSEKIDD